MIILIALMLWTPAHAETGLASWYSYGPTACGDGKLRAMSAAHKTLPCGARVHVKAKNGKSVEVTIRDRGPFIKRRIIDLDPTSAAALGLTGRGIMPVTIEVVR